MLLTAAILFPFSGFGLIEASVQFPWALAAAVILGVFGAAIPISLEYRALGRISPARYGVLVSTEPVVATAVGYFVLGQGVNISTLIGIVAIAAAATGMAVSGYLARRGATRLSPTVVSELPPRP
jgi:inner membrane transporter RhtA